MTGFKLIGIYIIKECSSSICKVLKEETFYQLDYGFIIEKENNQNGRILDVNFSEEKKLSNLYSIPGLEINVSAIVGKNGSGKSSLLEILYASCFLLGEKYDKIEELYWLDRERNPEQRFSRVHLEIAQELVNLKLEALFEIYFSDGKEIYRVINDGKIDIRIEQRKVDSGEIKWDEIKGQTLSNYFYSIAINYSIYGLNEKSDPWLGSLFHKNDGYQTPLVINPYRQNGNINVNNEYHLAQSRILSNLIFAQKFELIENRNVEGIEFKFDPLKTLNFGINKFKNIIEIFEESQNKRALDLFKVLYKTIFDIDYTFDAGMEEKVNNILYYSENKEYIFTENLISDYSELEVHLIKYVIFKIFKLVSIDEEYKHQFSSVYNKKEFDFFTLKNTTELIERISSSKSHLTLKIRQVLFALKSRFFESFKIQKIESNSRSNDFKTYEFQLSISSIQYVERQKEVEDTIKEFQRDSLDSVPVAYSKITLFFNNYKSQEGDSPFHKLSSGEQQLVLTLQTIYYHLYNLNSVEISPTKAKYNNICIILDEVELYFHPEYQRRFIHELINGLKKLSLPDIASIQILLSTHSPFILSDIPSNNILRLKEANPFSDHTQTFGANIHQLLHNDFFLENGFIGEFAKMKIYEVVDFLRSINWTNKRDKIKKIILKEKNDQFKEDLKVQLKIIQLELSRIKNLNASLTLEKCKKIIDLVGEPILLQSLNNLYDEVINFKQLKDDSHTY